MSKSDIEDEDKYASLKPRQQAFVDNFIDPMKANFNRTKAAVLAGYAERSARNQGYRMMKNDDILLAVKQQLQRRIPNSNEVLSGLGDIARGHIGYFLSVNDEGDVLIDLSSEAAKSNFHLLKKVKQTKTTVTGRDDYKRVDIRTEIEIYDRKDARIQLAKIQGLYVDKVEHSGTVNTGVQVIDFTDGDGD